MSLSMVCTQCSGSNFARDHTTGELVCSQCGAVAEESRIVSEVSFSETSAGKAVVTGQYVSHDQTGVLGNSLYGMQSGESRHQTLEKARHRMERIGHRLQIPEHIVGAALRFFRTALANNFVKGRKSQHVLSACLYLACRQGRTDHMLMDFAEVIKVNVFNIGATYLQLVRNQKIKELPIVDPTVYIQRFTAKLQFDNEGGKRVVNDAKLLVQRMGKDWLQQGRRPAGVAAACTLLAARMNNFRRSKAEIVQVAKVAEETLQRRLDEFKKTSAGTLTVQDFRGTNIESSADPPSFTRHRELERRIAEKLARDEEIFKEGGDIQPDPYLDEEMVKMARELDKEDGQVLELSNEVEAILHLPELKKAAKEVANIPKPVVKKQVVDSDVHLKNVKNLAAEAKSDQDIDGDDDIHNENENENDNDGNSDDSAEEALEETIARLSSSVNGVPDVPDFNERSIDVDAPSNTAALSQNSTRRCTLEGHASSPDMGRAEKYLVDFRKRRADRLEAERSRKVEEEEAAAAAAAAVSDQKSMDPESLSDVDDDEIEGILLNEAEIDLKSKVWMSINREYLLEQERKRLRQEADLAAGVARQPRKRRKQRSRAETGQGGSSAGTNAANMLKEKAHSKKINYAAVNALFSK